MTPNMGMAAPKGTQAPQAGLAALAQPAQAPKGKSPENMGEIMALARRMSDAQLADVLQGKSLDVPQFAAMTEAMGRKQLRQAVQGQQAMAQLKRPNLKDRLMGEYAQEQMAQMAQAMPQVQQAPAMMSTGGAIDANETAGTGGGIAELPAPNMEAMTMADGGIVAFNGESGSQVYDPNEISLPELSGADKKLLEKLKDKFSEWNQPWAPPKGTPAEIRGLMGGRLPAGSLEKEAAAAASVPNPVAQAAVGNREDYRSAPAAPVRGVTFDPTAGGNPAVAALANRAPSAAPITGVGTAAGNQPYSIPSYEQLQSKRSEDYLKKLEGLTDKQRAGLDKIKDQGLGEAALQMSAALFGSPNLAQAAAKGLPMVASTSAATRKEARAVENLANEYDLNLAKAQEAAEKGDVENQLRYMQLANEAKYRADSIALQRAQLGQEPNELRTLRAIMADPKLAAIYKGGKSTGVISREAALKEWGDLMPSQQKKYGSFNDYYNSINSTMGGGTDLQAQAAAELARRNK